ncbi:uncharacterized protein LOC130720042 [Lotus japonicus]|uniref:uncharacterized protein LOC130720042 n=1 Tax=Lotus japonicus TaxID=34305 RepID=UPI002582D987|nr:uncharacterized protein LOC130720042 [Lotus japonicus]
MEEKQEPHIAVVPSPGFTHLVPILEFSKRLLHLHPDFHITCIIPSVGSPSSSTKSYLQTLPPSITPIFLPPITLQPPTDAALLAVQIELSVTLSLPLIKQELNSLCSRTRVVALVVDIFAHEAMDFAKELNLLSYIYLPQAAMMLSMYFNSTKLDEIISESRDLEDAIDLPGCVALRIKDLPLPFQLRSGAGYERFLERGKRVVHVPDGVFVNTFTELEAGVGEILQDHKEGRPQVYPVGPIIQSGSTGNENGLECLKWLDKQEPRSVLYVSFGSGGTLSQEQFNELAYGLELSGEKFLWVVRAPNRVASATYFDAKFEDPLLFLPNGFLERTKERGLVVPSWVPQVQVLGHGSTGGFLSHCGWNSVLESVVQGVPVIAWPLFAEQSLNAALLSGGLKVALRPKVSDGGLVERGEIAKVVKGLMDGEEGVEIRRRMEDLKNAAGNAIKEGGSSTMALAEVAAKWRFLQIFNKRKQPSQILEKKKTSQFHSIFLSNHFNSMENQKPHIAVVPSPGFTHLVPILEFSKRLLHLHPEFHITCIIPSTASPSSSTKSYLQTLPPTITPIFLPPITLQQPADASLLAVQIEHSVTLSLPHIKQELISLCSRTRVVALVVDIFAHEAMDFARKLNLLSYIYLPLAAMVFSMYINTTKLDEILSSESRDPEDAIELPGFVALRRKDLPLPFQFRIGIGYEQFLKRGKRVIHLPDGVFVNSFTELEPRVIQFLQDQNKGRPQVYPVGPIIQIGSIGQENGLECLKWLDKQEPRSVLYVSFGSGGTLSQEQFNELAYGLELSGENFLWVVRAPNCVASATYLDAEFEDPLQFLPNGFLERTKERGLVVPSWVPQVQVLGHSSTGAFLSHCGWNSVLESVVHGVPVIAWPLFAEQGLNAAILGDDGLKVALRPKVNSGGLVERGEIVKVVKGLMEGEEGVEIRRRMEHLKNAAGNAIKEGGSSTMALVEVAENWRLV